MSRRGWALFALMGVVWGIPYLLIKIAVHDLAPATLVFARTAVGAAILVPIAARRGELLPLRPQWRMILLYTVIEVALPWLLLADAERRLSSSLTGLMVAAVPLIGAALAWALGDHDRLDRWASLGLILGLLGVGALVGLNLSVRDAGAAGEVMLVAVCYAVGPLIVARRLSTTPRWGVVAASILVTCLLYAPAGLLMAPRSMPSLSVVAAVLALGVVCTALAFIAFFALIAEAGPVRATVITYVNPAVALLLGVLLLREPFTAGAATGFGLILAGSVLANRRSRPEDTEASVRGGAVAEPISTA